MAKFYDEIPEWLFEWIKKQQMFFVATAPLSDHGHINLSPKGTADCFHVVNSKQVWYEDLSGSGIETISHIRENGRITVMFCAFEGPPRILRLFGTGTVHEYGSDEYNKRIPPTSRKPGSRAAIALDIYQVSTSCGFAVPVYNFVMHRTQLNRLSAKLEDGDRKRAASCDDPPCADDAGAPARPTTLRTYWLVKNLRSLDGLPGLLTAPDAVLSMTPLNNFDEDAPRPMLRRDKGGEDALGNRAWFVSGLALGAVAMFVTTRLVGRLTA